MMKQMPVALVTGASRGIGSAIAHLLAEKNYFVFLNAHSSIEALQKLKKELSPSRCAIAMGDVSSFQDVTKIFSSIAQSHGGLDLLVNNAGISHIGLLTDLSIQEWDRLLGVNLSSVFYTSKAALPYMIHRKQGKILNISSMWGQAGASMEAAYSATKAGVDGLTKALAKELAPSHIQVNALSLGVIDTSMNEQLSTEERQALTEAIPAGRFGTCQEVAQMAWQILSSPSYLTGQVIRMDGGYL